MKMTHGWSGTGPGVHGPPAAHASAPRPGASTAGPGPTAPA